MRGVQSTLGRSCIIIYIIYTPLWIAVIYILSLVVHAGIIWIRVGSIIKDISNMTRDCEALSSVAVLGARG